MQTPLVVTDMLDRAASLYGSSTGVVCGHDRLRYDELKQRIDRLSSSLTGIGVRRGDVVACLSFNCHRLFELYFAVPQTGAILLPINIRLTPDDIAFILNDAGASVVVVDRALAGLLAPIRDALPALERVILMGGDPSAAAPFAGDDYEALVAAGSQTYERPNVDENDVAELFYTSGTTDRPKGVMLTHRNLYSHAMSVLASFHPFDTDVQIHTIPLFHVNGWGAPHTLTFVGGRHVMLPRFEPEHVLETIERERVTILLLVPTMALALLHATGAKTRDLRSIRVVKLGGAAAPQSLIRALDEWLPGSLVYCGYGLTETAPVLTIALPKAGVTFDKERSVAVRSTAGMPLPGVCVEILDEKGRLLPHDGAAAGEVCARGNSIMLGYWRRPEDTAKVIIDGWFHTGDVGTIDPQGYVSIVDRKKDIIISGGENIASIEIEKAIYEHPAVFECAVIAIADARWGEVPAALIVLKPGAEATADEILHHCKERLAHFKMPKRVKFTDALPKGGTGKILKRQLRAAFSDELSAV